MRASPGRRAAIAGIAQLRQMQARDACDRRLLSREHVAGHRLRPRFGAVPFDHGERGDRRDRSWATWQREEASRQRIGMSANRSSATNS